MSSLKDMRAELRALRKESVKPVSRMKKMDVAAELERLRGKREETPPVASTDGASKPKKMMAKVADVKVAKEKEFPTAPVEEKKKAGKKPSGLASKTASADSTAKTSDKMAKLMKMIEEMSDSE